jgi:hypothetical protein
MVEFENKVLKDLDKFTSQIYYTKHTCANLIRVSWFIYRRVKRRKLEEQVRAKAKE